MHVWSFPLRSGCCSYGNRQIGLEAPGSGSSVIQKIGAVQVDYAALTVSSPDGTTSLEPKVMAVLQALANDGLAPRIFGRLTRSGQPAIATWVSGGIALAAVLLGGLNMVARFVTILFLTLYVTINLSAAFERLAGDPSYRPRIRVPCSDTIASAANWSLSKVRSGR